MEGWYFLLRWFHFLAGITWIGVLYYFNFIQTPFFGTELGGGAKGPMTRGLVPNALWWFRWGAMFTFITGWNAYLIPFTFTLGSKVSNLPVYLNRLQADVAPVGWNQIAAVGLFQLVPIMIFFIFTQEMLLNIYSGGAKGGT